MHPRRIKARSAMAVSIPGTRESHWSIPSRMIYMTTTIDKATVRMMSLGKTNNVKRFKDIKGKWQIVLSLQELKR